MTQLEFFGESPYARAPLAARDYHFSEVRVRTRIASEDLDAKRGKVLSEDDYDVLLHGPTAVYLPDGRIMAKYLPGALRDEALRQGSLDTLREIVKSVSDNRGEASGYERVKLLPEATRSRTPLLPSAVAGSIDPGGAYRYCRLTAFTGSEWDKWSGLHPLFGRINEGFRKYVPDRYAAQQGFIERTHPEWIVGDTVFTTITVNRSYPTGVHTDSGDLDEGFSNLAVYRSGSYRGGVFVFPEYRVGVDMQDGDLLLMDAHQWHGNTAMTCNVCGQGMGPPASRNEPYRAAFERTFGKPAPEFFPSHAECGTERISIVCYYRTKMVECGTKEEEYARARRWAEKRIDKHANGADAFQAQVLEEMAAEAV